MDKRILTLAGIILLIAAVIFGIKFSQRKKCVTPDIIMEPEGPIKANSEVSFSAVNVEEGDQLQWVFDDGSQELFGKTVKRYMMRGDTCEVKLIVNGKKDCSATGKLIVFEESVNPDTVSQQVILVYTIEGPANLETETPYRFKANGSGGKTFLWDFAETGDYSGKEQIATYTYKAPGKYTIKLHIDDQVVSKEVRVTPKQIASNTVTASNKGNTGQVVRPGKTLFPKIPAEEIQALLNSYGEAARDDDDAEQLEILKKLKQKLCNDETIPVVKTNDPSFRGSFEDFYHKLQFKFKQVKNVSLEYDPKTGCTSKIIVTD